MSNAPQPRGPQSPRPELGKRSNGASCIHGDCGGEEEVDLQSNYWKGARLAISNPTRAIDWLLAATHTKRC